LPFCHFAIKAEKPKHSAHPNEINTLGDRLRAKRLDLGLTQQQVAQRLGIDETTVHNWERNHKVPVVRLLPRMIQFLGYSPYAPALSLPEQLKMCRRSLGLSQRKLAKALGVDESSLRNWESGRRKPSKKSLRIIEVA
jgi:transcriptional regulator with XRE-family HTH domain